MLEHVWPQFLHQARCNVLVPESGVVRPSRPHLPRRDRSGLGQERDGRRAVSQPKDARASGFGFDSEDRHLPEISRAGVSFLHLARPQSSQGDAPGKMPWRRMRFWARAHEPGAACSGPVWLHRSRSVEHDASRIPGRLAESPRGQKYQPMRSGARDAETTGDGRLCVTAKARTQSSGLRQHCHGRVESESADDGC